MGLLPSVLAPEGLTAAIQHGLMTGDRPSLTHELAMSVDLLETLDRLDIEALTVDEAEAIVIYWSAILKVSVMDRDLTNASAIAVEVWDEGDTPPDVEPADLPTKFVAEIENTLS